MSGFPLGEYLRRRRASVRPDELGLLAGGDRRVPGLRREEVAVVAGVSADYYRRLEQGRERHPSAQVLDALARTLRLDDSERRHLYHLAGIAAPLPDIGTSRVDPALQELVDGWRDPALVYDRACDLLAANPVAELLFDGNGPARNLLHHVFLDPRAREVYVDWAEIAMGCAGILRLRCGEAPDDARVRQVLAELLDGSPEFRRWWDHHDVVTTLPPMVRARHPEVGVVTLRKHAFDVRAAPGQTLLVLSTEPGSASAASLCLLGTPAADH